MILLTWPVCDRGWWSKCRWLMRTIGSPLSSDCHVRSTRHCSSDVVQHDIVSITVDICWCLQQVARRRWSVMWYCPGRSEWVHRRSSSCRSDLHHPECNIFCYAFASQSGHCTTVLDGFREMMKLSIILSMKQQNYRQNLLSAAETTLISQRLGYVFWGSRHQCPRGLLSNSSFLAKCSWSSVLFLAVLNSRVGHTMDALSQFTSVLCRSDWLFHGESSPRIDVVHPGRAWSSSPACTLHCSLHYQSLSPGNSLVSSWCDHSMLTSLLWHCVTVLSLL